MRSRVIRQRTSIRCTVAPRSSSSRAVSCCSSVYARSSVTTSGDQSSKCVSSSSPEPAEPSWQGHSVAEWTGPARGGFDLRALVSGGALRYRMYAAVGLSARQVASVVLLAAMPYFFSVGWLIDLSLLLNAETAAGALRLTSGVVLLLGAIGLAKDIGWLAFVFTRKQPLKIGGETAPDVVWPVAMLEEGHGEVRCSREISTRRRPGSPVSGATEKPRSRTMASISVFSASTSPSMRPSPSARAASHRVSMAQAHDHCRERLKDYL